MSSSVRNGVLYLNTASSEEIVVMKPSSDHELEIARRVDERAFAGELPITAIAEIAAAVPFAMSEPEIRFLISYIVWRRDHPIGLENSA